MPKKKAKKSKKIKPKKEKQDSEYLLKKLAIRMFGRLADRYSKRFTGIKDSLITSDMKILFRTYLSMMFFATALTFVSTFVLTLFFVIMIKINILLSILGLLIMPSLFASIVFLVIYVYPVSVSENRKRDIEANLPFAMTHMAAVAESGAPPLTIFKILSKFREYGEISREAEKITRNVEVFGLDELSAIRDRSMKCPSSSFRDVLQGMLSTIQTGGNIRAYLKEESGKAMFDYAMRREKYNQILSTYADLYTALLIAAPMMFIVVVSTLSVIGGNILGLSLEMTMVLGLGTLVFLNMIFLVFIQLTQPRM
jgi:flagellar protein FlaJ